MSTDLSKYRHDYPMRVRSFHVDRQNVVHNIWYFYFLEEARVEYLREIGLPIDEDAFISHHRFYVVRNTCDYYRPAVFDDEIIVKTRTEYVKNSSVGLEHAIVNAHNGELLVAATHIIVHVNAETNAPERIPDYLRDKIRTHEGDGVRFVE